MDPLKRGLNDLREMVGVWCFSFESLALLKSFFLELHLQSSTTPQEHLKVNIPWGPETLRLSEIVYGTVLMS